MIEKEIMIEGKPAKLKASGLIPVLYRAWFGRDLIRDMRKISKAYGEYLHLPEDATDEEKELAKYNTIDTQLFGDVAWTMLKHAGEDVGETSAEWLESLDGIFTLYEILPDVLELWSQNNKTTAVPRKNETDSPRAEWEHLHAKMRPFRTVARCAREHNYGHGVRHADGGGERPRGISV